MGQIVSAQGSVAGSVLDNRQTPGIESNRVYEINFLGTKNYQQLGVPTEQESSVGGREIKF